MLRRGKSIQNYERYYVITQPSFSKANKNDEKYYATESNDKGRPREASMSRRVILLSSTIIRVFTLLHCDIVTMLLCYVK